MLDKDKIYEKWKILESLNIDNEDKKNWLSEYAEMQSLTDFQTQVYSGNTTGLSSYGDYDWSKPLLPIAMKVSAHTLGGGGWQKSKKQQTKENRLNKLRQLKGEEPNVLLPNDEYIEGLVSVKPMSAPSGSIFYMDNMYKESDREKKLRLQREQKEKRRKKLEHLNNLIRVDKIKYITEILKNN